MQITNDFIKEYFERYNLNALKMDENRPWGAWYLYEMGVDKEKGESFDKKIIYLKPCEQEGVPNCLSLQFHGSRTHPSHKEKWQAITDVVVLLGNESMVGKSRREIEDEIKKIRVLRLLPGEMIEVLPGYLHTMVNPFVDKPVIWKEIRVSPSVEDWNERENNITRICDNTGRDGAVPYPDWLINKIISV